MLLQILPTDLIAVRIIPLLPLVDKIALYHTNRLLRSLLPNLYQTLYKTTIKNLNDWAMKTMNDWNSPDESAETFNQIIAPICSIRPHHRPYFIAFYKLVYNMHYFNLIMLNNTVYRMGQKDILQTPYRDIFLQTAMTVYMRKFQGYIETIENETDAYLQVVLANRIIPDEIKIRKLAGSYIDLKTVEDYEEISQQLAAVIVGRMLEGRLPNYQFRHSFVTQEEKLMKLLRETRDGLKEDAFMQGMGMLVV